MEKAATRHVSFRNHLERFVALNDDQFEPVLAFFTVRQLKKHQVLIAAGDSVKYTYWIQKGLVASSFTSKVGKEHIIQFANEGCWVTDQNAFYNRKKATFDISALEPCELLSLSFENREKLCDDFPVMEKFFRRKANDSFVKQQKRLLTYLTSDPQERFETFFQEYPDLLQRLSKKTLAAYLGVSRETLSRLGRQKETAKNQ